MSIIASASFVVFGDDVPDEASVDGSSVGLKAPSSELFTVEVVVVVGIEGSGLGGNLIVEMEPDVGGVVGVS